MRLRALILTGLIFCVHLVYAQYNLKKINKDAREDFFAFRYQEAIQKFDLLITYEPGSYDNWFLRGVSKYSLEDFPAALKDFDECLRLNPFYKIALHYRALVRDNLGDYYGSLNDFESSLKSDSANPRLYMDRAIVYLSHGKALESLADCRRAVGLKYLDETLFLCMGACEFLLNKPDTAIIFFSQAIKLNPFSAYAYTRRAEARFRINRYEEGMADLDRAQKLDSTNTSVYYLRARAAEERNDNPLAEKNYQHILQIDPYNDLTMFQYGLFLLKKHQQQKGTMLIEKTLVMNPRNLQVLETLAKLKASEKKYQKALEYSNRILQIFPYHTETYFFRAEIFRLSGNLNQANAEMQKGKNISEMNRLKTPEQKIRDSLEYISLTEFKSSLESQKSRFGRIQNQNVPVKFTGFYLLSSVLPDTVRGFLHPALKDYGVYYSTFYSGIEELKPIWLRKASGKFFTGAWVSLDSAFTSDTISEAYLRFKMDLTIKEAMFLENVSQSENPEKEKYLQVVSIASMLEKSGKADFYSEMNRALALAKTGNYPQAWKSFNKLTEFLEDQATVIYNMALCEIFLDNRSQACVHLSEAGEKGIKQAYFVRKKFCH